MRGNLSIRFAMAAVLSLAALVPGCGGEDKGTNPTPAPGADVTIEIVANNGSNSYSPNPATARLGQKVAWHNAHVQTHTATADGGAFDTGNIAPGGTCAPITMNTAGTFPYHCTPHPSMVATPQVTP